MENTAAIVDIVSVEKLNRDLHRLLDDINRGIIHNGLQNCSEDYKKMYTDTLSDGVKALSGVVSLDHPAWDDAMKYGREVMISPRDNEQRAVAPWMRSHSRILAEYLKRFGPGTIEAARSGLASIIETHYHGNRLAIAHVDKRANHHRNHESVNSGAGYYPKSSPLAINCYHTSAVPCSLVMTSWLPPSHAVQIAQISHVSTCEDYGGFTAAEYDVRLRLVALAAGVAYQHGGDAVNLFIDASALKAVGTGTNKSIESAMFWRVVCGGASAYSRYSWEECDLEEALVAPTIMMAMHDIFDWRSDTAAGYHENSLSAVYGLGLTAPFHPFLEAMLSKVLTHPKSGIFAIGGMVWMHFTSIRYSSWEYRGEHESACPECVRLTQAATVSAHFEWTPKPPPESYEESKQFREWNRLWSDYSEDRGIMQEAVSWFQYLIFTGRIWLFDVLADGVVPVDKGTGWI